MGVASSTDQCSCFSRAARGGEGLLQSRDLSPQWLLNNPVPPYQALSKTGTLAEEQPPGTLVDGTFVQP